MPDQPLAVAEKSNATRLDAILTGRMHEAFTVAADQAVQRGYVTQEQRKALSHAMGEMLDKFNEVVEPSVAAVVVDADCADAIANKEMSGAHEPANCPECGAIVAFPAGGWYQCPACGEPFYAKDYMDDGEGMPNGWLVQSADDPDVSEADMPKELTVATLVDGGDGETNKAVDAKGHAHAPAGSEEGGQFTSGASTSLPPIKNQTHYHQLRDKLESNKYAHDQVIAGRHPGGRVPSQEERWQSEERVKTIKANLDRLHAYAAGKGYPEVARTSFKDLRDGVATKRYAGVSADLWPKMEKCVLKVMAGGKHDKSSAIAICHASIMGTGSKEWDADESAIAALPDETRTGVMALIGRSLKDAFRGARTKAEPVAEAAAVEYPEATLWDGGGIKAIFKDERSGKYRWVLFSSSAYEDNDRETVSRVSLENDADRMTTTKEYGPLRFWHVGEPNRAALKAGPGLDLGTCDFSAMHGNIAVESGLFNDDRVAEALIPHLKELGVSRGFFHPIFEPDDDGTFHNIFTFERSILPRTKASNRLTQFYVTKEVSMRSDKEQAFKALLPGGLADEILATAGKLDEGAALSGLKSKETTEVTSSGETVKADQAKAPASDRPDMSGATPAAAKGPSVPVRGLHNHLHAHMGSMHSHEHFHPNVHELMNTNGVSHHHEHTNDEGMTLKAMSAAEKEVFGVPEGDHTHEPAAPKETIPQPTAEVETEPVAESAGEEFALLQAEAFKEQLHDVFIDVLQPFLDGLAGAAQKQAEGFAGEIAEVRAELKAVSEQNTSMAALLDALLGEQSPSALKEMRASQAESTIVGSQAPKAGAQFNAQGQRFKDAMPQQDGVFDFIDNFVMAGMNGDGSGGGA